MQHHHHHSGTRIRAAALFLSVIALCIPSSFAKSREKKEPQGRQQSKAAGIYLIGHLPLPETTVSRITDASDSSQLLLQLTDAVRGILTIIDVAQPARPKVLQQSRLLGDLAQAKVQARMGDAALLTASHNDLPVHVEPQSVTLVSFADPSNPKTVQKFEGVTAVWIDRDRELIYLSNGEGLWILRVYSAADRRAEEQSDGTGRPAYAE